MTTTSTERDIADEVGARLDGLHLGRAALVIVDVQNDFCDDYAQAALGVPGGGRTAATIRELLARRRFELVVATRDYHVDPGAHFSDTPDYTDTWPAHCVVGTHGAEFHPQIIAARRERPFDAVVSKGRYTAAYSGFEYDVAGEDLDALLRAGGVDTVVVVGIETAHCVAATVVDAARAGFRVVVPLAATASLNEGASAIAVQRMLAAGDVTVFGWPS